MDKLMIEKLESDVFKKLISHLQNSTNVQNIDLMNTAGFCRNCLAKWYVEAAKNRNIDLNYEEARNIIYGMSYEQWKNQYQKPI
ncbi:MAG: DUF1244 domain-containing protein [Alphaproteobacteria bacterium]|nr:DUF1244 domain-containing protein [Alphaproteobacteria bacterium]